MFTVGAIINVIAILLGVGAGMIPHFNIPPKTQNLINTIFAAILLYIAGRIGFYEIGGILTQTGILSLLLTLFLTWGCLVISNILFKKSPWPRQIRQLSISAQQAFQRENELKETKSPTLWHTSLLIGIAFFCLTPLSFAASALFGAYSDPRLFIVKGVIDFMGTYVFTRTLKITAIAFALPTILLQIPLTFLFDICRTTPSNIISGMSCVGFVILFLCLHCALILLRWKKSGTLFSYVPALFLALLIEMIR